MIGALRRIYTRNAVAAGGRACSPSSFGIGRARTPDGRAPHRPPSAPTGTSCPASCCAPIRMRSGTCSRLRAFIRQAYTRVSHDKVLGRPDPVRGWLHLRDGDDSKRPIAQPGRSRSREFGTDVGVAPIFGLTTRIRVRRSPRYIQIVPVSQRRAPFTSCRTHPLIS